MEQIIIKDKKYYFEKDYRDNKKLRDSFNELTRNTYGFDFSNWYDGGYWGKNYIPYSVLDNDKVVSNVSVNTIDYNFNGHIIKTIQLGTVMTDENYRHKGLSAFLIEKIVKEYKDKCDIMYLFANDSVLDFYPKFGFVEESEYKYSRSVKVLMKKAVQKN